MLFFWSLFWMKSHWKNADSYANVHKNHNPITYLVKANRMSWKLELQQKDVNWRQFKFSKSIWGFIIPFKGKAMLFAQVYISSFKSSCRKLNFIEGNQIICLCVFLSFGVLFILLILMEAFKTGYMRRVMMLYYMLPKRR